MSWDDKNRRQGGSDDVIELEAMFREFKGKVPRIGLSLLPLLLLGLGAWLFAAFYTVGPDERGVVMRFGKLVRVTEPGFHFHFWPIERVQKPKVTEVQRIEVGFRTVKAGPPADYSPVPEESLMLTGDENIVALDFIVQFRVKLVDGEYSVRDYLFNVKPTGRYTTHNTVVKQAAEAAMREVVGYHLIEEVLTEGKQMVQDEAQSLMQGILDQYEAGIEIVAVQLQDVQPPTEDVRLAFKDVASAREDKERLKHEARGYRNDLLPKARGEGEAILQAAEGYAKSKVLEARGQANRFISVMEAYRSARKVTRDRLYLDTLERVLPGTDKLILNSQTAEQVLPYLPLDGALRKNPKRAD